MARQQARRRNRERLTGIILACLGVVVLVVAAIALAAPGSNEQTAASRSASPTASTPSATPSPSATRPATTSPPSTEPGPSLSLGNSSGESTAAKLPLVVLNNTNTNGLATDAAKQFRDGGWKVSDVSNLSNDIVSSCAYYDPDVDGAEAAAKALRKQFPGIQRVVEKFPELPSGPIVVVLTSDYSTG